MAAGNLCRFEAFMPAWLVKKSLGLLLPLALMLAFWALPRPGRAVVTLTSASLSFVADDYGEFWINGNHLGYYTCGGGGTPSCWKSTTVVSVPTAWFTNP